MPSRTPQRRQPSSKDKFTPKQIAAQYLRSLSKTPRKQSERMRRSLGVPVANVLFSAANAAARMASHSTRRSKSGGSGKGSRKKRRTSRSSASDAQR
jgi:hypothetical protein